MAFNGTVDDIALIELADPVRGVEPAPLYTDHNESGRIVEIIGRGATGNGLVGQYPGSPHVGELRAYSRVIGVTDHWLKLRFDAPPDVLPLEGVPADGECAPRVG